VNPTLKLVLLVSVKNAVNAVLTNSAFMAMLPTVFNMHSHDGWWNIGKMALATIGSRESMIWLPKMLKWSTTE
jgi:hypothetical protein